MAETVSYGHGGGGLQHEIHRQGVMGVRRREGGSPPLPSWKLYKNPFYDGLAAAVVAAASAATASRYDDAENGEEEGVKCMQKQGRQTGGPVDMGRRSLATSFTSPTHRAPSTMVTKATQHLDDMEIATGKAGGALHQGSEAQSPMAMAPRSSAASIRRGPLAMVGGMPAAFDKVATEKSTAMQGVYEKDTILCGVGGCRGPKDPTSKDFMGMTEVFCQEASMSMAERASDEKETSMLAMVPLYPIFLPARCDSALSPSSPCSHLQPWPASSTSDSPCSSKSKKASKVYTKSPQLNRSPQHTSLISPRKTVMLMHPKAGGEVAHLQGSAMKRASSNQRSSVGRDALKQQGPPVDGEIITSPRDYLRAANRFSGFEEKKMEGSPVIPALNEELKCALTRVQELEHFQISARKEVDGLLRRLADERALLKTREQEKIQAAVFSIEEELDKERKVRRKLELENRKLSRNLAEASKAVVKAEKELDKERKARQLMEDVCDELAKEIGEDKAELEELKREHAKAREEMEEERRMLQMAEAWREERVQMKLSEARFELEERCMAVNKLKMELEMYLNFWEKQGIEACHESQGEKLRAAAEKLKTETSWSMMLLENGSSHTSHSPADTLSLDGIRSLRLSRDNIRSQSEWGAYSDEHARRRAKWATDSSIYHRGDSGQVISSNNSDGGDKSMLEMNADSDMHNKSWSRKQPMPRWRWNEESMTSLPTGQNGHTNFDDSDYEEDTNSDEANEASSNGAGSMWGDVGEDEGQNINECRWSVDGEDDTTALRHIANASGSASEEERGSLESFFPESSRRKHTQGMKGFGAAGLDQDHGGHVEQREYRETGAALRSVAREHVYFWGARHNGEEENELSSAAGSSSSLMVHKLNGNSPNLMVQQGSWLVAPAHHNVESSVPQGRNDLVEWGKPFRNDSLQQKKLLLDDGLNGLHLQSRHSKGPRLMRG